MYERLKKLCKDRGLNITQLCSEVTHSSGNLSTWKKGYMRSDYLSLVADKLQCSTDYLLGRTDTPTGTYSINGNNNVQVNGHNGDHSPLTVNNTLQLDEMERNLIEAFRMLEFPEKIEAISGLIKKAQKKAPSKDGDN